MATGPGQRRPGGPGPAPGPRALAPAERRAILAMLHSDRFADLAPAEAWAILAGFELTLGLRRPPGRLGRLSGPVGRRVRRHRKDLFAAAAGHGVSNLRVFGSVARGEDRADSDVDLLADFPPGLSLFGLGRLEADLEAILGSRVNLVAAADLKPGARQRVESDLIAL